MKTLKPAFIALALALPAPALAADVTIEILNKHPETSERNVYLPAAIKIAPGDTVTWVSTDRGHNVEFVSGAIPDGVAIFRSPLSKDVSYTFEVPGVYVYKCTPHYGLGMVGIVVVGDVSDAALDAAAAKRYPPKSNNRIDTMIKALKDGS